ncbi:hypothetical protein D3C85_1498920 [compost metagenome]
MKIRGLIKSLTTFRRLKPGVIGETDLTHSHHLIGMLLHPLHQLVHFALSRYFLLGVKPISRPNDAWVLQRQLLIHKRGFQVHRDSN